jgi:hypothetical protein
LAIEAVVMEAMSTGQSYLRIIHFANNAAGSACVLLNDALRFLD